MASAKRDCRNQDRPRRHLSSSRGRHAELLCEATREFSMNKRPLREETERYKELFYQLIDRLEKTDRRLVSALLARSSFTPRPVALYLAQDALEVAAPLLLFSPVLTDLDLRAIAGKRGKIYADVIKKRQLPMEAFTAEQLHNAPVQFDGNNHRAVDALEADNAPANSDTNQELIALAGRGGRLGRDSTPSTDLFQGERPETVVNHGSRRAVFKLPKRELRTLFKLARLQDHEAIATQVEDLSGLPIEATLRLLRNKEGEEALYLIKAFGISSPHDIQLGMLLLPSIGRSIEAYRNAKQTLASIDPGICRLIFNEVGAKFELGQSSTQIQTRKTEASPGTEFRESLEWRRRSVLESRNPMPRDAHFMSSPVTTQPLSAAG